MQIFRSDEKRSVILYIIYGKSGARWEPSKRDYNRQMLSAIHEDSVLRGDLATIICGDFNLTVEDATDVFNLYKKSRWVDAALFGNTGFDDRPTSMKGHGARIDMALLNHTAASLACQYDLMDGINTEDHRILDIKMHVPCAAQHWYMPKRCSNAIYQYPSSGYEPPQIERDKRIQQHLAKNNLEDAYKQWSLNAENLLATIPATDKTVSFSHGRGRTAWRRLTVYPPEGFADTDTVWCRQLAKALRQVEELVRMQVWGHRADNTYNNLRKFIIREQNNFTTGVLQLVPEKINRQTLEPLQSLISQEYKQAKRDCGQKRLKAWKARLQSSEKQCYKWVQGWAKVETLPMKRSDGRYTIDRTQQLQEILNEWIPIFQKFKQEKPQVQTFIEHFGPNMRYQDMSLCDITGPSLVSAAKATSPSSHSLDNWKPEELTMLAWWYPVIFDDLASIYNRIEALGRWPKQLMDAYTSLIPKDDNLEDVRPTDFRPITVLSSIYRLYAKTRFGPLLQWQEGWVTEQVFGCRPGRSAETMALHIAMDLESKGYTGNQFIAGVSYDCRKAFDLIPIEIAMKTMKIRGCHPRILRAVQGLYTDLRRVFRLNGAAGQWWTSSNGLVQGDPISMVMLNSLVTCVIESTNRIPVEGLTVRSYADDLSSVVVGRSPEEAKNKLRSVHAVMRSYVAAGCGELNDKKCFTFGNAFAKGILNPSFRHLQQFSDSWWVLSGA